MPKEEKRNCQNCHGEFLIDASDFEFYSKIKVPPPTFCPQCRLQRRLVQYNERVLYTRMCDACGKKIISRYPADSIMPVYDHACWQSDAWDALEYGREYNFSKSFFEQFYDLLKAVPVSATINVGSTGCDYCGCVLNCKNCYLSFANSCEDSAYVFGHKIIDSCDVTLGLEVNQCYAGVNISQCNGIFFSEQAESSYSSSFLYDCRNVNNSFLCTGLRNKEYYFLNKPLTKEEYQEKLKEYDLGSYNIWRKTQETFKNLYLSAPHKYAHIRQSENVTGNNIQQTKNCYMCFDTVRGVEDCKYISGGGLNLKNSYDVHDSGTNAQYMYESVDIGLNASHMLFSIFCWEGYNIEYSKDCNNCKNIFGCNGLRNKEYCIFNKQYTKEEYERLVGRIKKQMGEEPYIGKDGVEYRYGEFFPTEHCQFAYNETMANDHFPISEDVALVRGYGWAKKEHSEESVTLRASELPDHIRDVRDDIVDQVIECEHKGQCDELCNTVYKIIPMELRFLREKKLALPRFCPSCRQTQRVRRRNPYRLWHRACQCSGQKSSNGVYTNTTNHAHGTNPCPNEFETSYAPDRPEIVYCEQCYQAEVV